jgi:hypothetical protein
VVPWTLKNTTSLYAAVPPTQPTTVPFSLIVASRARPASFVRLRALRV